MTDLVLAKEGTAISPVETVPTDRYIGIAHEPLPPQAAQILLAPVPRDEIEVRPDGLPYWPEMRYRQRLTAAVGPGAWAIKAPEDRIRFDPEKNVIERSVALYIYGRFIGETIGEQQYFPENSEMTFATAAEGAKSNGLMRIMKDIPVASELWIPEYSRQWVEEYCEGVWCEGIGRNNKGKKKLLWRKKIEKGGRVIDTYPWREIANVPERITKMLQRINKLEREIRSLYGKEHELFVDTRELTTDEDILAYGLKLKGILERLELLK